jgi:hypothetical protein
VRVIIVAQHIGEESKDPKWFVGYSEKIQKRASRRSAAMLEVIGFSQETQHHAQRNLETVDRFWADYGQSDQRLQRIFIRPPILPVDEALPDLRLRSMHNPEKKANTISACRPQAGPGGSGNGHRNGAVRTNYLRSAERCAPINSSLADYMMTVNADAPPIDVHFLDYPDREINELGARGIGEIGLAGVAAAISDAVHHAPGVRVRKLPVKIENLIS